MPHELIRKAPTVVRHQGALPVYDAPRSQVCLRAGADWQRLPRSEVEGLEGAFVVADLFDAAECARWVEYVDSIGFKDTVSASLRPETVGSQTVLIDGSGWLAAELFARLAPHMPRPVLEQEPCGVYEHLRVYRYREGEFLGPHYDANWQSDDGRISQLTFIVTLSAGYEGGETRFHLPNPRFHPDAETQFLDLKPAPGAALCFHHGFLERSPLHESVPVRGTRSKYVLRGDVLYA